MTLSYHFKKEHWIWIIVMLLSILTSCTIAFSGFVLPLSMMALAVIVLTILLTTNDMRTGFYLLLSVNFLSVGLTRYLPLPLGLLVDFLLLALLILFFLSRFRSISWKPLQNPVFLMITCWMVVNILELANPESRSFLAWFYAMRGVALYFFLTLLIAYLCLERKKDMNWFLTIWFLFSILGTLWGLKQLYWGLDNGEKNWLNIPGNLSTHVLFGRLRVFSFYSDAGQFGASQAHTALVAILLFLQPAAGKRKWFYLITAVACFYGMLISGTRGAFAIPLVGGLTYLILMKNFKVFLTGISLIGIVFFLLKFTFIGQSNYQIQRLRSSLNPQDASLQVRIINQKKLANYLDGHWFGGGVGSGGYWGQRFSPNTFLANLALDSWYVRIAAEYGYIGLLFYLAMLIFIVYRAYRGLQEEPDPVVKYRLIAIFCGLLGILVASYGNQVFGQMPTSILIYLSIVFLTAPAHSTQRIHEKSLP